MSAETKGEAATSALTFYDLLIEVTSPGYNQFLPIFSHNATCSGTVPEFETGSQARVS